LLFYDMVLKQKYYEYSKYSQKYIQRAY